MACRGQAARRCQVTHRFERHAEAVRAEDARAAKKRAPRMTRALRPHAPRSHAPRTRAPDQHQHQQAAAHQQHNHPSPPPSPPPPSPPSPPQPPAATFTTALFYRKLNWAFLFKKEEEAHSRRPKVLATSKPTEGQAPTRMRAPCCSNSRPWALVSVGAGGYFFVVATKKHHLLQRRADHRHKQTSHPACFWCVRPALRRK